MRNIIVVDARSTGLNYIGDIVNRGYNPVVLQLRFHESNKEERIEEYNSGYASIDEKFDMIYERDTYEETLEVVRKWDPKLVIPSSEEGVVLATKLANDLDLLCNPIENMDYFTFKDKMQEKIAEAGLRHIKGKSVRTLEEAIEYYDNEGLEDVIVKPVYCAASVGVHMCLDRQQMIKAVEETLYSTNVFGGKIEEVVIQERIKGEEYYLNTTSCDGVHQVVSIWKYNKVQTPDGSVIYDTIETVNELSLGESEMVEYAYKVTDALGIKYGPVHGEYMLDENGPVLIEVNCRPAGCSMPADYLDRIEGHHETDLFLDSYLKPKRFHQKRTERYRLNAYGALKIFIVPEDIVARSAPMNEISPKLRSFYMSNVADINNTELFYVKTVDLETSCGFVYMVHEDKGVIHEDIEFLRRIEKDAFSLVLSKKHEDYIIDDDEISKNIREIVDITQDYGAGLLITDQFIEDANIIQVGLDDLEDVNGEFDYVIVNLNKSLINKRDDITVSVILKILSDIRVGGLVCVPESTYNYLPSKRKGIEALMKTLNLRIEVPPYGINAGVIASRNNF
ncbi:ATP-grasp domain-containing protein [Methanobrevibacter sp.]|uniref:ATP-grasp domain-containing protein n=1 Tax=Methanobrevibacter sp. TaxID=66852 RepID=UPI00388E70E4